MGERNASSPLSRTCVSLRLLRRRRAVVLCRAAVLCSGSRFAPVCHNIGVNSEAPRLTLPPLKLGNLTVDTPVVLAPMAGVTNKAFRRLCSEYGGGLYVTEMVTARALVERKPESMRIIEHDPDEKIRSIQIYGVDAVNVGKAVRMVVEEDRADHIDS